MEKRSTSLSGPDIPSGPALRPAARTEVELKLLASPAAIERIRAASVIVQHARNRGVVRRLETVYYDTPDHALSRERSSLRVRRNGTRGWRPWLPRSRHHAARWVRHRPQ